jgi:hypothetical protein
MVIKPIETVYNGYRFRSRIEARWAVFFDALGIEYQYEPEGFELDDGTYYLPDFWLPSQEYWIEIKGSKDVPDAAWDKATQLAQGTGKNVYIFSGQIGKSSQGDPYSQDEPYNVLLFNDGHRGMTLARWSQCPFCGIIRIDPIVAPDGACISCYLCADAARRYLEHFQFSPRTCSLADLGQPVDDLDMGMVKRGLSFFRVCGIEKSIVSHLRLYAISNPNYDSFWIDRAYDKARQARFEHGESPQI